MSAVPVEIRSRILPHNIVLVVLMVLLPFMPTFVDAWLTSPTRLTMTPTARSVYLDLLMYQWKDGYIPNDPARLAEMAHVSIEDFRAAAPVVLRHFNLKNGKYRNKKLAVLRKSKLSRIKDRQAAQKQGKVNSSVLLQLQANARIRAFESVSDSGVVEGSLQNLRRAREGVFGGDGAAIGYDPLAGWEKFCKVYPHFRSKNLASQAWLSVCDSAETEVAIFAGLERWKLSNEWARGVYNSAERWLMDRLWEGNPAPARTTGKALATIAAAKSIYGTTTY